MKPSENREKVTAESIYLRECEESPNKLCALAMSACFVVLAVVLFLNETGIFHVNALWMRISVSIFLVTEVPMMILIFNGSWARKSFTKYLLISEVIVIVFVICIVLNFHVTLCYIIPILFAMQYKNKKLGIFTSIASMVVALITPSFGYLANTWDASFLRWLTYLTGYSSEPMTGYVSLVEMLGIANPPTNNFLGIMLMVGFPQALIVGIVCVAAMKSIDEGIRMVEQEITIVKNQEKMLSMDETLLGLASVIDSRDENTGGHVSRVKEYTQMIVEAAKDCDEYRGQLTDEYAEEIVTSALLHDIGKISVSDRILNKKEGLTAEEYDQMKRHTLSGEQMIDRFFMEHMNDELVKVLKEVTGSHHEKWDGTGYPRGIKGNEIPLSARIVAIADVYDALISVRSYKKGMSDAEACDIIRSGIGTQFDPGIAELFLREIQTRQADGNT